MKGLYVLSLSAAVFAQTIEDLRRSDLIFPFGFKNGDFEWPLLVVTPSY
jgi:hypothetical protein